MPGFSKQLALADCDVRDQAQVIVGLSLLVTDGPPATDRTVLDRLGVGAPLTIGHRR